MEALKICRKNYHHISVFIVLFLRSLDACTLPNELVGTWLSSEYGALTLTNTSILNLDMGTYGKLDFECYKTDNATKYVLRSSNVLVISPSIYLDIFTCFDIETVSSTTMYKYWQATTSNSGLDNQRATAESVGASTTIAAVCNEASPYEAGSYRILLKNDSVSSNVMNCPSDLQYRFNYTYDYGGSNLCAGGAMMDNCLVTDKLSLNYTYCATEMFYSAGGDLSCLHETTNGSLTYLTLYNNDVTTDESSTYRFSCMVFSTNGMTTMATQYPQNCASGQTDSVVSSPGVSLLLLSQGSCTPATSNPNSNQTTTTTTQATTTTAGTSSPGGTAVSVIALAVLVGYLGVFAN